jgi:hypothetical protein
MFRKIAFALATTAALGAAALATTAASAHPVGGFGGPHFGHGPVFHGPVGPRFGGPWGHRWGWGVGIATGFVGGAIVADSCLRREVFDTPYGPRVRWVNVCY